MSLIVLIHDVIDGFKRYKRYLLMISIQNISCSCNFVLLSYVDQRGNTIQSKRLLLISKQITNIIHEEHVITNNFFHRVESMSSLPSKRI